MKKAELIQSISHLDRKYEKYQDMLNYYKNK